MENKVEKMASIDDVAYEIISNLNIMKIGDRQTSKTQISNKEIVDNFGAVLKDYKVKYNLNINQANSLVVKISDIISDHPYNFIGLAIKLSKYKC